MLTPKCAREVGIRRGMLWETSVIYTKDRLPSLSYLEPAVE